MDVLRREIAWTTVGRWSLVVLVGLVGALAGLLLAGNRTEQVGPLEIHASVVPSLTGDSVIDVPPLGTITLDTHDTITLKNVAIGSLHGSDFIVSPHHVV